MALAQCFSLLLLFSSLHLTDFTAPDFSFTYLGAHMRNLTCNTVNASTWQVAINHVDDATGFHLQQAPTTTFHCHTGLDYFGYHGSAVMSANMNDTAVRLLTNTTDDCLTEDSVIQSCSLNAQVLELYASPPSVLVDALLSSARLYLNANLESYLCGVALPDLQTSLANHTDEPWTPVPALEPGAQSLSATPLFRAVSKISQALPLVYGMKVSASVAGPATLALAIEFPSGKRIHFAGDVNPANRSTAAMVASPEVWMLYLRAFLNQEESLLDRNLVIPGFPGHVDNSNFDMWIPRGTRIFAHIDFAHLWCEQPETYRCFVQRNGGIRVTNMRVENAGDAGTLFMRHARDSVMARINERLDEWVNDSSTCGDCEWFELPMRPRASVTSLPPLALAVIFVLVATVSSGVLMAWNVRRHRASPIASVSGEALSVCRIVFEDMVLSVGVFACTGCFLWSNMTTAATVVIGTELDVYSFSLMSTVEDLWQAGLKPLSVCVFLFSGVYPYFKLLSILVFTLVLQRPDATVLHVIDYLGKLSLLDTFVMVIMVAGLTVPGIADVRIFAPFYVFVASTLGSIALGNYATCVWRRGTMMRLDVLTIIRREARLSVVAATAAVAPLPQIEPSDDRASQDDPAFNAAYAEGEEAPLLASDSRFSTESAEHRYDKNAQMRLPWTWTRAAVGLAVVLVCSLPAWYWPCLRYRLDGVASLATTADKSFSLSELAWGTSPTCFLVTFFTVVLAPCLYVWCFPKWQFLASWCAADALVIACVAGLLQLNQFVQFVLGPGMEGLYTAHAVLLWTLAPLTLAAAFVWLLAGVSLGFSMH